MKLKSNERAKAGELDKETHWVYRDIEVIL